MRLLHVVHQYPPDHVGGTEYYTQTLAQLQVAKGHQVSVFVPSPDPRTQGALRRSDEDGVTIYRVSMGRRAPRTVFLHGFGQSRLGEAWEEVLRAERPDIVHVQHLMGLPWDIAKACAGQGVPYVVTLHDYWYGCANGQLLTNTDQEICQGPDERAINCGRCALARAGWKSALWLGPLVSPLMRRRNSHLRRVVDGAARAIAPTEFVRQKYVEMGLGTSNTQVVPHGIELPRDLIERARQKRAQRVTTRPLRVGYVGSIAWQKGVHVLIEAAAGMEPGLAQLTIYGNLEAFPDYAEQLAGADHATVRLAGPLPRHEFWSTLADFDVMVMPTLWYEASPLTIDEIFAVGIPIVASRLGAMSEKIEDGRNGRLFAPGDAIELRSILQELAREPQRLAHLAQGIGPVRSMEQHWLDIEMIYQSAVAAL